MRQICSQIWILQVEVSHSRKCWMLIKYKFIVYWKKHIQVCIPSWVDWILQCFISLFKWSINQAITDYHNTYDKNPLWCEHDLHRIFIGTLKILLIWSISDFPGNRGFWVSSSPKIQPTDHMSTAVEYSCGNNMKIHIRIRYVRISLRFILELNIL